MWYWITTESNKFSYWIFIFHFSMSPFIFSLSLWWIRSLRVKGNNFTISSPVAISFKNCFKAWNNPFHTEKHLVSNRVETNYEIALLILLNGAIWFDSRWRAGEGAAIHLQTPCLSAIQKKSEGAGRIEHVIEKSIELFKTHMEWVESSIHRKWF